MLHWLTVGRRFLRERVLYSDASPTQRRDFDAHAAAVTARVTGGMAILGCIATVLWWPADFLIYADAPHIRAIMFDWRISTLLAMAPIVLLQRWSRRARENPVWVAATLGVVACGLATWTCGRVGRLDAAWFGITYVMPFATVAFVVPFFARMLLTFIVAAAAWGGYFLLNPAHLDEEPRLWLTVSLLLWVVLTAVGIGQILYHYLRVAFFTEQALATANSELDGKVRAQTADLRRLTERIESLQERECTRIAGELHRTMGEDLSAIEFEIELLGEMAGEGGVRLKLDSVDVLMARMRETTQRMIYTLRPKVLDELGLAAAVEKLVADQREQTGLAIDLALELSGHSLGSEQSATAYRVLQEALTNVVRHARATRVGIDLRANGADLTLSVRDDGSGFLSQQRRRSDAAGITGMRERAHALGGECRIESSLGGGTLVTLRLPGDWRAAA